MLAVIFVSAAVILARPHYLGRWANILGIMATILAATQDLPQIWMTWHLGHVGSSSIPMMLIQTPGSFVWSASLAARLGYWEGWSTWGVFFVQDAYRVVFWVWEYTLKSKTTEAKQGGNGDAVSSDLMVIIERKLTLCSQMELALLDTFQARGLMRTQMMKAVRMWRKKMKGPPFLIMVQSRHEVLSSE